MSFIDFDNHASDRDLDTNRVIVVNSGERVTVRKDNQYGFWTLHLEKGQLPARYRGKYTSYSDAKKDLVIYLQSKLKHIKAEEM